MKRKFKLFATVASLCLCLALMAFGVYAASTVTYTASGSVKFELVDVFVTMSSEIEYKVNGATNVTTEKNRDASKEGDEYKDGKEQKSYSQTGSEAKVPLDQTSYSNTYKEVEFKKTGDYLKLTVTIKNDGANSVNVAYTLTKPTGDGIETVVECKNDNADIQEESLKSGVVVASGKSIVLTLTTTLLNMEYNVTTSNYSVVAEVTKANASA